MPDNPDPLENQENPEIRDLVTEEASEASEASKTSIVENKETTADMSVVGKSEKIKRQDDQEISEVRVSIAKEAVKVSAEDKEIIEDLSVEGGEEIPKKTLMTELLNYASGRTDLKESPHIVEHFSPEKIREIVSDMSDFYNVPQKIRERGLKSDVCIVKDDSFVELEEAQIRVDRKEEGEKLATEEDKRKFEQSIKDEAQKSHGREMRIGSGRRISLIKESHRDDGVTIPHEILHFMSRDEDIKIAGLSKVGTKDRLDEATTEGLALHWENRDLNIESMVPKIANGEIDAGYKGYVSKLLTAMYATELGEKPFTFNDLSQYYFHEIDVEDNAFTDSMVGDMVSRAPPEFQEAM